MTTSLTQQNLYKISYLDNPIDMSTLISPSLTEEDLEKQKKLEELRKDIGGELFNSLSERDRQFIIETEGIVDLGYEASDEDLKRIYERVEK